MEDMKQVEIKNVDLASVFKFFGGTFMIIGLIIGLFGGLFKIDIISTEIIRIFPFIAKLGSGIFIGIAFAIIYGLSAGVGAVISALLYNFFAALMGGIRFDIRH